MAGNVWEWVSDWYDATYYNTSPATDPKGGAGGPNRIFRGGGHYNGVPEMHASRRGFYTPDNVDYNIGFRCARTYDLCAGVTCPDLPCSTQTCDPGNGQCVPATKLNGGVCSVPNELSNLAIWFDASDATTVLSSTAPNTAATSGQSIVKWLDKSGNGADVSAYVGYSGPVLAANVANGKPVARFTGTAKKAGQMLVGTQSVGSSAVTLIAVYAYRALPVAGSANFGQVVGFGIEPADGMGITCNQTPQAFAVYSGAVFNEATLPTLNQFRSESLIYDQSNVQAFLNGASMGAPLPKSGITLDNQFMLGAHRYYYSAANNGWEYFANADIAEVIVYKRALSASERAAVEGYLKVKYNLP